MRGKRRCMCTRRCHEEGVLQTADPSAHAASQAASQIEKSLFARTAALVSCTLHSLPRKPCRVAREGRTHAPSLPPSLPPSLLLSLSLARSLALCFFLLLSLFLPCLHACLCALSLLTSHSHPLLLCPTRPPALSRLRQAKSVTSNVALQQSCKQALDRMKWLHESQLPRAQRRLPGYAVWGQGRGHLCGQGRGYCVGQRQCGFADSSGSAGGAGVVVV
jgi:hypothetical protein